MKHIFTALLCLLLAGCFHPADLPAPETEPANVQALEAASRAQAAYGNTVTAFSLPLEEVQQYFPFGEGLLLHSGHQLLLLDAQFRSTVSCLLDFDAQVTVSGEIISAFDPVTRQLHLLDNGLQELRCIILPQGLSGAPLPDSSGNALYYAASNGIYRWDLSSGIRRRIQESDHDALMLIGLHCEDQILHCRIRNGAEERDLFLSADNGQLLQEHSSRIHLLTYADRYYAAFSSGFVQNLVYGTDTTAPRGLFPADLSADCVFLPRQHAAVTMTTQPEGMLQLDYYSLESGVLLDSLLLPGEHAPKQIFSGSENTVLLAVRDEGCDILLQWQPKTDAQEGTDHTDVYYTADDPDHAGLTLCSSYAQELSERFGVEILIWKEAAAAEPWDYTLEAEHRYPVILQQLQTLEKCLSRYPESILSDTAGHFDSLKLCLVSQITGTATGESLSTATGIQFFREKDAYVVLAAGKYGEQALYHELFHVMETHILGGSNALDRWNELNPAGFSYDLDHGTNAKRNSGVYLEGDSRAFVDTYSMSFPKEDRARIFEYAMLPNQEDLFHSPIMQQKLLSICTGIRETYGLTAHPETFPWEQYLT